MAKYIALQDLWLSDQCIKVKQGEIFEAVFPENFNSSGVFESVIEPNSLENIDKNELELDTIAPIQKRKYTKKFIPS